MQNKGFVKVFAVLLTLACVPCVCLLPLILLRDPLSDEQGGRRPEGSGTLP